jgi:membrane carboxypeptidase/penicillin-binding protein PbpC
LVEVPLLRFSSILSLDNEWDSVVENLKISMFYIVSEMPEHRYLEVLNNRIPFVIKTQNGRKSQQWYFDQKSLTIKTRLNNQSWDIQNAGKTNNM